MSTSTYCARNALGQPVSTSYSNGVTTYFTYEANTFRLKSLQTTKSSTTLQNLEYAYDNVGNVQSITDYLTSANTQTFGYDDLNRLTSAAATAYGTLTYTYNEIGNMLSNSQVGTYAYPTSGSSSVRPHAVTTAGSNSYTYDANGNMLTGAGRTFNSYDLENRPTSLTSGGQTTTFIYDGDGGRVKKQTGSSVTWYISKLYECDAASCTKMIFSGDKRIVSKTVATGAVLFFHGDHLGSTSIVTDSTGANVQALTYYPFGATRTNVPGNPDVVHKYTGKELDVTGLYWYEWRSYDPVLARFTTPDRIVPTPSDPQEWNRYSYVGNNPLRYTDPTGYSRFRLKWGVNFNKINIGKFLRRIEGEDTPENKREDSKVNSGGAIASVVAGTLGFLAGGPILAGAASAAASAAVDQANGGNANILRSAFAGAAGGLAGGVANLAAPGDVFTAGFAGGATSGVVSAAVGGGNLLRSSLYGGAAGALNPLAGGTERFGPIWNGPNTLIGAAYTALNVVASVPVSVATGFDTNIGFSFGNGGLQVTNAPLVGTAITLGEIMLFGHSMPPNAPSISGYEGNPIVLPGRHEAAHIIHGHVLGPAFIPAYMMFGGPFVTNNPFDVGADNFARGRGTPWSGF